MSQSQRRPGVLADAVRVFFREPSQKLDESGAHKVVGGALRETCKRIHDQNPMMEEKSRESVPTKVASSGVAKRICLLALRTRTTRE